MYWVQILHGHHGHDHMQQWAVSPGIEIIEMNNVMYCVIKVLQWKKSCLVCNSYTHIVST